jgi:hypothetical protein
MCSRSATIVRHHHPLFIIITPRAPQPSATVRGVVIVQDQQNRHGRAAVAPALVRRHDRCLAATDVG